MEGVSLKEAQDDATALVIAEQEEIGLDLLTDGEQRRTSFIHHIIANWSGIDLTRLRLKATRRTSRRAMDTNSSTMLPVLDAEE